MAKRVFILGVIFLLLLQFNIYAGTSKIEEFGISNINIPQGYSICTRQIVQSEFETTFLKRLGKTYDEWVKEVMEKENIYIYASNRDYDSISIRCEKVTQDEIIKYPNGTVDHKLIKDYNIVDSALDKEHLLINYDAYLASRGIASGDISKIWWEDEDGLVTPFICVLYKVQNIHYMDLVTIYNGTQVTMMITSKEEFTKAQTDEYISSFKSLRYDHTPDYDEVKKIVKENYEITNRQSSDVNDESKGLLYICIIVMVLAIVYAIELDRKRNAKKNKSNKNTFKKR